MRSDGRGRWGLDGRRCAPRLIRRANYLLDRQSRVPRRVSRKGGFTGRLYRMRPERRDGGARETPAGYGRFGADHPEAAQWIKKTAPEQIASRAAPRRAQAVFVVPGTAQSVHPDDDDAVVVAANRGPRTAPAISAGGRNGGRARGRGPPRRARSCPRTSGSASAPLRRPHPLRAYKPADERDLVSRPPIQLVGPDEAGGGRPRQPRRAGGWRAGARIRRSRSSFVRSS